MYAGVHCLHLVYSSWFVRDVWCIVQIVVSLLLLNNYLIFTFTIKIELIFFFQKQIIRHWKLSWKLNYLHNTPAEIYVYIIQWPVQALLVHGVHRFERFLFCTHWLNPLVPESWWSVQGILSVLFIPWNPQAGVII